MLGPLVWFETGAVLECAEVVQWVVLAETDRLSVSGN